MQKKIPPQPSLKRLAFRTLGRVAPTVAGRWACSIWFSTRRYPEPRREQRWIESARQDSVLVNGVHVATYTWESSSRKTVVLVHGWNGRGPQLGNFVAPLTRLGYRVVAFDAPGHGRTPGSQTNIYEFAEALQGVANHYAPVYAVIAHSFGVPASVLAMTKGLEIVRAVGISSPASATVLLDRFSHFLNLPAKVHANLRQRIEQRFGEDTWTRLSVESMARNLRTPALIVHDRNDEQVPLADGERVAGAWPDSELMVTEGLGHRSILGNRNVCQKVVEFVTRH